MAKQFKPKPKQDPKQRYANMTAALTLHPVDDDSAREPKPQDSADDPTSTQRGDDEPTDRR